MKKHIISKITLLSVLASLASFNVYAEQATDPYTGELITWDENGGEYENYENSGEPVAIPDDYVPPEVSPEEQEQIMAIMETDPVTETGMLSVVLLNAPADQTINDIRCNVISGSVTTSIWLHSNEGWKADVEVPAGFYRFTNAYDIDHKYEFWPDQYDFTVGENETVTLVLQADVTAEETAAQESSAAEETVQSTESETSTIPTIPAETHENTPEESDADTRNSIPLFPIISAIALIVVGFIVKYIIDNREE